MRLLHAAARMRSGLLGIALTLAVVAAALLAPYLAPHDPAQVEMPNRLKRPFTDPSYPLGADQLGRDILSRVLYGARVSLVVAVAAVAIAGAGGTAIGLLAGFYGRWWDTVAMRIADVQLSFPFILLALVIAAVLGPGLRNIIATLVISSWVVYARLVRGEVLALKEREFVHAAAAQGASDLRLMLRHLLPNLLAPVIVLSSLQVAQIIVAEAAISFLGFGIQPPDVSWGNMMAEGRDHLLAGAWWLTTWPGVALTLTALGVNLMGDWLRDVLDPRLRI